MAWTRDQAIERLTGPGGAFRIVPAGVLGVAMRIYADAPPSLRVVLESTAGHGDDPFLVYSGERSTFAQHLRMVARVARALSEDYGITKGDRVAIAMRNHPEWVVTFWALQALGAVAVPLNAWWTGDELRYALDDSGATVAVVDGERMARLKGHVADLHLRPVVVRADGPLPPGARAWSEVIDGWEGEAALPPASVGPDDDATILYTSGTTGRPKGAVGTHRNHVTNLMNTAFAGALRAELLGGAAGGGAPPAPPSALQTFPFFHIGGLTGLYVYTAFGGKLVLQYKWDLEEALGLIQQERITALSAVPTVVRQILESPLLDQYDISSVAGISSGGAPVPPDLIHRIDDLFTSRVSPANGYGLTETTSAVVVNSGAEYVGKPDSVGRPVPVADVRVVDPASGVDRATGEIGELWFRGPNIVRGYWNKPEATAEAFTDGWFHTGDLGHIDDDGFVYVVDRLKDVVIRGGENVYCAEVEAALFEHPAVADVAIVGLPHRSLGEEVAAVVQLKDEVSVTATELQQHAAARLAAFKVPAKVFFRSEPLPRTATGKVLKRDLRESLAGT